MGQGQAQCGIEPRAGGTKGTYLIASSTARRVPFSRVYPVSCRRLHAAAGRVDEKRRTDVMSSSAPSSGIIELQQARGAPLPTAATALPPVLVSRAGGLNSPSPPKTPSVRPSRVFLPPGEARQDATLYQGAFQLHPVPSPHCRHDCAKYHQKHGRCPSCHALHPGPLPHTTYRMELELRKLTTQMLGNSVAELGRAGMHDRWSSPCSFVRPCHPSCARIVFPAAFWDPKHLPAAMPPTSTSGHPRHPSPIH